MDISPTTTPSAALQPIDLPLRGLQLIEASAGTGKTYTICLLYLRLVLEAGHGVESLLVVTFTKAAAAELRERIRSRLVEALAYLEQPSDGVDPMLSTLITRAVDRTGEDRLRQGRRIRTALQCFDQAAIFTIHGFCQRALADAPFVAGVPLQTELLQQDDDLRLAVVQDGWRRSLTGGAVSALLLQELVRCGDTPERVADLLQRVQAKPLAQERWSAAPTGDAASALAAVQTLWAQLQALWPDAAATLPSQFAAAGASLNKTMFKPAAVDAAFAHWQRLLAGGDPWAMAKPAEFKLHLLRRDKVGSKKGKAGTPPLPDHPLLDIVAAFLDARDTCVALGDAERRVWLRQLLETCGPALRARKRELRVQAFDDLLFGLYAALTADADQGAALAENLRTRFPVALVDEFQDTDPLQWQILQRIYQHTDLPLFLVGDPKQAIYRFRNADLPTYLAARDAVPPGQRHTLMHNQRSSAALIAACNALFTCNSRAFIEAGLEYVHVLPGSKPRVPLHDDDPSVLARAALQVWLLPRDADGQPFRRDAAERLAVAACADEIVRLLQGAEAGQVRLGTAALPAQQIAVLVQTHQQGRLVRETLERRGVGCVERSQASIFAGSDARDLLCLLSAIVEPGNAALAAAALGTTWLGLTAAQIDDLRAREQGLAPVMETFADARQRWLTRGFAGMMQGLLARHDVQARLLQREDGMRRLTNLRHLLELLQAEARLLAGPEALLAWLRSRIATPGQDDEAQLRLESDAQLVQIVTVHAAKGLEYAVVFCPFFWVNAAERPEAGDYLEYASDQPGGGLVRDFRVRVERETDEQSWIKAQRRQSHDAERLRLLYVGLTRAAQRCHVVAGAYGSGRPKDGVMPVKAAATGALCWLLTGAGQDHAAWRNAAGLDADAIDAAWHRLAERVGDPAVLAVVPLPPENAQTLHVAGPDPAALQAAVAPATLPERRRVGSYSGLVATAAGARHAATILAAVPASGAGAHATAALPAEALFAPGDDVSGPGEVAAAGLPTLSDTIEHAGLRDRLGRDHDAALQDGMPPPDEGQPPRHPDDILQFPRGADAGTVLHGVLEQVDFQQPADWPAVTARVLARAGLPATHAAQVLGMLQDVVTTLLPPGFRLADVARRRCRAELEFHLPAPHLLASSLRMVLARHGHPSPDLHFPVLQGHLKGFIDLVFEHAGRWYVIDWKSNHLGNTPAAYASSALRAAVATHDYGLQAALYLLALDRFLARRLRGYQRATHLGGALYLFVRGVRPGWREADGQPTGVWFQPAVTAMLDDLSAALAGAGASGQAMRQDAPP